MDNATPKQWAFLWLILGLVVALIFAVAGIVGNAGSRDFQHEYTKRVTVCLEQGHSPTECSIVRGKGGWD